MVFGYWIFVFKYVIGDWICLVCLEWVLFCGRLGLLGILFVGFVCIVFVFFWELVRWLGFLFDWEGLLFVFEFVGSFNFGFNDEGDKWKGWDFNELNFCLLLEWEGFLGMVIIIGKGGGGCKGVVWFFWIV